mgnify:CR=1 FL=1
MISNKSINISNDFAMRVFFFLMAIITSSVIGVFSQTSTPKKYTIRYEEKVRPGDASFENQKLPAKIRRSSSNKGEIKLVYEGEFPDSMKVAITAAADLWEAKISNKQPIYIGVCFGTLDPDVAMAAEVDYCDDDENNLSGCPTALASQIRDAEYSDSESPDGWIILNSNTNWDCNFTGKQSGGYNLTTAALRGIARCLGFGSSIIYLDNAYSYYHGWPTYFDKLLYSNSIFLSELTQFSSEMANFVKSDNVFLDTPSNTYKIYAPTTYKSDISLNYLDEDKSLMTYSIGQGNCILSIDEKTFDILRTIGWDLPISGLRIKCSNIQDDGIGSSYENHSFHLDTDNSSVSNYRWRFYLKDKSEKFIEISSGNTAEFTINQINSTENYFINLNGDLEGKIECDYTFDGEEYSAIPFKISLELKPIIISINNVSKINSVDYGFSLMFNVNYIGANKINVNVEEDYSTFVRNYQFDEPFIAHVMTGNISALNYSWVTIEVRNQYGSTFETLEFEPDYNLYQANEKIAKINGLFNNQPINKVQILNLNGTIVFDGKPSEFSKKYLSTGIYVRKDIYYNGISKTSKFIIL